MFRYLLHHHRLFNLAYEHGRPRFILTLVGFVHAGSGWAPVTFTRAVSVVKGMSTTLLRRLVGMSSGLKISA